MKVKETAQISTKQFEEAIWCRKNYLDTARGHYLSALAGLSGGKQEQTKVAPISDSSLLLEDHVCNQAVEVDQAFAPEQRPEKIFSEIDVPMQLPNVVLKAPERDLEAVKLQFNKTLARNTESQITEMICKLGSFGNEMDINDGTNLRTTRMVPSESDDANEPLPKIVTESSSLCRMVESLKAKLESLKKEHAELSDVDAGLSEIDAGAESAVRNLHLRFFRSELENGDCFGKRDKGRETSKEVIQDKDDLYDSKIKARELKREQDAVKISEKVAKRPRIALDVDEEKDCIVNSADLAKSFPEGIQPACVSTSESSARVMISEDELESSSQQVGKSDKLDRGSLVAATGGVDGENCDDASEFSIRDFVFAARNRDISLNWPFSQKNLQLCLKHGVKDVLPPFQPTDSLRDSSMNNCSTEKILHSEESNVNEKQSMLKNHIVPDNILELNHSWNQDLAEGYRDSDSFPTGGERGSAFKTIVSANCQSEVESVSTSNLPLSEVSDEREAAGSAANKTNSSASQLSSKKVKVAVKMRVSSKRNTPEDITSACTGPPETISSKICPVCENFSSSSNTTLNAHIDQCLSSQSPPIWMKSSKIMKPRIKPRKIRLMTDICATAPCCTLEDLDRRNGTNWATNVDFPLEESDDPDVPSEQGSPGVLSKYPVQNVDDGSVYIDSSGRKIRILSKFNDTLTSSFSKAREDPRPKKQSKKAKRSKVISPNRKKRLAKHLKYLKVTRQRKRSLSLKVKGRSSEACEVEEAMHAVGGNQQSASFVRGFKAQEQGNPDSSGAITKLSRCEVQAAKDLLIGNDQAGNTEAEPRRAPVKNFRKRSLSSTQNNTKTNAIYPAGVDQRSEGSCRGRMLESRSPRGATQGRDVLPESLKTGSAQFNKKIAKEFTPMSSDSIMVPAPPLEREVDIQPNALQKANITFPASRGLLNSCCGVPSERMRPCNSKTILSPICSHVRACQANSDKLDTALENSCNFSGKGEAEAWPTGTNQQPDAAIDHPKGPRTANTFDRSDIVKVQQKQALEYGENGSKDTNNNDLADGAHGNYNCVSTKGLHNDSEFIASVSSSSMAIEVIERSSRTALDPELEKVADVSHSKLLQCSDKFQGSLYRAEVRGNLTQPDLNDGCDMFHGNVADAQRLELKTGDYILNFGPGFLFPEVDPIPIPGPPGSDLPSFSDMGSEDLHRSSLSNSLAQPSGLDDNLVDGDLSESPFSATSTISNLGRSRTSNVIINGQESLSVSLSVSDNIYPGWFGASSGSLPTESSRFIAAESERVACVYSLEKGMVDLGSGLPVLNRDSQQCCCSQKEEVTQSTMTSQESQLLQWRPTLPKSFSGGNYTYSTLDGHLIGQNDRSAVFSSSSYRRTESVNLPHSVETSHQSVTSLESSLEAADPLSRISDYGSTSPAPILRLMGKDLRVSNRVDADLSRSQAAINVNVNKFVKTSWEPQLSQSPTFMGPLPHGQDPDTLPVRHFDVRPSNMIHSDFGSHNPASGSMHLNEHMHGSFSMLGAGPLQR